jgi:nucleotide-binding universal stress UspA family protein
MFKKVIVPLDGSELAECVLPHVETFATGCEMPEITFLYVVKPKFYQYTFHDTERVKAIEYLEKKVKEARDKGLDADYEVLIGNPSESVTDYTYEHAGDTAGGITDYAEKKGADLIVIATHGRSGISRWTHGSVADKVLRSSSVPVLMVRALAPPVTETKTREDLVTIRGKCRG